MRRLSKRTYLTLVLLIIADLLQVVTGRLHIAICDLFVATAQAQSLSLNTISTIAKSDPLIISGAVGTQNTYRYSSVGDGYGSPLSNSFYANLNISVYGISMPFSFYYTNAGLDWNYPHLTFRLTPAYKNWRGHFGNSQMSFSSYVMNTSFGAASDSNTTATVCASVPSTACCATPSTTTPPTRPARTPQYKRVGWGFKFGYGSGSNYIDLYLLRAYDRPNSIDESWRRYITPQENIVVGLKGAVAPKKWLSLSTNAAVSLFSSNTDAPKVENNSTADRWDKVMDIRYSSLARFAGDLGINLNVLRGNDYNYVADELVKTYIAPYTIANSLCISLKTITQDFVDRYWFSRRGGYGDDWLDTYMRTFNNLNRGRYLEFSDHGFNVRVPYYQLPLIFGDCWGDGATVERGSGTLPPGKRTFYTSIGNKDMRSGDGPTANLSMRWPSQASNLLFFRLSKAAQKDKTYPRPNASGNFESSIFNRYTTKYADSYNGDWHVDWDEFDLQKALKSVSDFRVQLYRVDCYDISTGLYTVSPTDETHCGGGPWVNGVYINSSNATAKNLGQLYEAVAEHDEMLENTYDFPTTQVMWCYEGEDPTLVFYHGTRHYHAGDDFPGVGFINYAIDNLTDIEQRTGWYNRSYKSCTKVIFDPSFKDSEVTTMRQWFYNFSALKTVEGIQYLPTKKLTSVEDLFYGCKKLTSLNFGSWDVSLVKDMSGMFQGCSSLTTLNLSGVTTRDVTTLRGMFDGCSKLTSLNLSKFKTSKVTTMSGMFRDCSALTSLTLPSTFTGEALSTTNLMFSGCSSLATIDLTSLNCNSMVDVSQMFYNCSALRTLHIDTFNPSLWGDSYCTAMFYNVRSWLTCYYFGDLDERIVKQIPGTKKPQADQRYKVVRGRYTNGDEALFFLKSTTNYKTGSTYTITTSTTEPHQSAYKKTHSITVMGVWSDNDVMDNGTSKPGWISQKAVKAAYIDGSFDCMPRSTNSWFDGLSNLENIYGLATLNTSKVVYMSSMFEGCSNLVEAYTGKFNTSNVTNMERMFYNCSKWAQDYPCINWDLSKVKNMSYMFYNCKAMTAWPFPALASEKTSSLTNVKYMFYGSGLTGASGRNLNVENVTSLDHMFANCKDLSSVPSLMNTSKVTDMESMLEGCSNLTTISLEGYDTKNVRYFGKCLSGCTKASQIILGDLDLKSVTNARDMFASVPSSATIYIPYDAASEVLRSCPESTYPKRVLVYPCSAVLLRSGNQYILHFVGEKVSQKAGATYNRSPYSGYTIKDVWTGTYIQNRRRGTGWGNNIGYSQMWNYYASEIKEVNIDASFKKVPLINAFGYFSGMTQLTEIKGIGNLNTKQCEDLGSFFKNCKKLNTLSGGSISTESAKFTDYMFYGCEQLTSLSNVTFGNTDLAYKMEFMFAGCKSLSSISRYNYPHTGKAESLEGFFKDCANLTDVPLSNMKTDECQDMSSMFEGCTKLSSVSGVQYFNTDKVTYMEKMFKNCKAITELNLSKWTTKGSLSLKLNFTGMFDGCTALRTLRLGTNSTFNNCRTGNVFTDVQGLNVLVPKEKLSTVKSSFTNYYGFTEGITGNFYDDTATETAQVVYTPSNKTLTFYYGMPLQKNQVINHYSISQVWSGTQVINNTSSQAPWASAVGNNVTKVVIDKSFANARPTTTKGWFSGCKNLTGISGLENLSTWSVTDMSYMFNGCSKLTSLDLKQKNFDTSKVTNMSYMFQSCSSLYNLNIEGFSTYNVKSMRSMFHTCKALKILNLENLYTTNVTDADYMFYNCTGLQKLQVKSGFNFPNVKATSTYTFYGVKGLEVEGTSTNLVAVKKGLTGRLGFVEKSGSTNGEFVETDKFSYQAVWTSRNNTLTFFYGKELKVGGTFGSYTITNVWKFSWGSTPWHDTVKDNVTKVVFDSSLSDRRPTSLANLCKDFKNLTSVTGLSYLNTSQVSSYSCMFYGCKSLTSVDVSRFLGEWAGSSSTYSISLYCMFYLCEKLTSLDLSKWKTDRVSSMGYMFGGCKSLTTLDLTNFETKNVTNMSSLFSSCEKLTTIKGLETWNTINVTRMDLMFNGCKSLSNFNPTMFNTSNVTTMLGMFANCESWYANSDFLVNAFPNNYNTAKVTTMAEMFYGCKKIAKVNIKWNTSNVTKMNNMFEGCEGLTSVKLDFDTKKVTTMESMFEGDTKLRDIDITSFRTPELTNMSHMFKDCTGFISRTVDLSNFSLAKVTNMASMFRNAKLTANLCITSTMRTDVNMNNMCAGTNTTKSCVYLHINSYFKLPTNASYRSGVFQYSSGNVTYHSPSNTFSNTAKDSFNSLLTSFGYGVTTNSYGSVWWYVQPNGVKGTYWR